MIQAELHGKLPEVENSEDVLISNIFGLLSYLPPSKGIYKIFEKSSNYKNNKNLLSNLNLKGIDLYKYEVVRYLFWQKSTKYGEPDLILILESEDENLHPLMFVIEVKYFSDKSRIGEFDQLKDYFVGAYDKKGRSTFSNKKISEFNGIFVGVVYLTFYPQHKEVLSSVAELKKDNISDPDYYIYELRWNDITNALKNVKIGGQNTETRILKDIISFLEHKNFVDFEGFSEVTQDIRNIVTSVPIFFQDYTVIASELDKEAGFSGIPVLDDSLIRALKKPVFFEGG